MIDAISLSRKHPLATSGVFIVIYGVMMEVPAKLRSGVKEKGTAVRNSQLSFPCSPGGGNRNTLSKSHIVIFFLMFSCSLWSHSAGTAHAEEDLDEEVAATVKLWINMDEAGRGMQSHGACWGQRAGYEHSNSCKTSSISDFAAQHCSSRGYFLSNISAF